MNKLASIGPSMRLWAVSCRISPRWALLSLMLANGIAYGQRWDLRACDGGGCPATEACISGRCAPVVRVAESIGNRAGLTIHDDLPYADFVSAAKRGFATWTSTTVTECSTSYSDTFGAPYRDKQGRDAIDVNDGINVVIVLEGNDWTGSSGTLAVTHSASLASSGAIVDADLEINGNKSWATDGRSNAIDIQSVVTHEAGHFLGLGHRTERDSIMYPAIAAGSVKRVLAAVDSTDVCTLYPGIKGSTGSPCASNAGCSDALVCDAPQDARVMTCTEPCTTPGAACNSPGFICLSSRNGMACLDAGTFADQCKFCTQNADCLSGICSVSSVSSFCSQACTYDLQCVSGSACDGGFCYPSNAAGLCRGQCASSQECPNGFTCDGGTCLSRSTADAGNGSIGDQCRAASLGTTRCVDGAFCDDSSICRAVCPDGGTALCDGGAQCVVSNGKQICMPNGTGCSCASSPGDAMALGATALWIFLLRRRRGLAENA